MADRDEACFLEGSLSVSGRLHLQKGRVRESALNTRALLQLKTLFDADGRSRAPDQSRSSSNAWEGGTKRLHLLMEGHQARGTRQLTGDDLQRLKSAARSAPVARARKKRRDQRLGPTNKLALRATGGGRWQKKRERGRLPAGDLSWRR